MDRARERERKREWESKQLAIVILVLTEFYFSNERQAAHQQNDAIFIPSPHNILTNNI